MKVLITGGAGFVGRSLSARLLAQGHEVHVLDNFVTGFRHNIHTGIHLIEADLSLPKSWQNLSPMDVIFHLGAMVSVPESVEKPLRCVEVNEMGTILAIQKALEWKARLIFASSAAVYGDSGSIQDEMDLPHPKSPYGLSKLASEHFLSMASEQGLSWVAFRKFNIFGPGQAIGSAYASVIPKFIARALAKEALQIHGDGRQTRDFVYIGQVVDYYLQAMNNQALGVFNMGNGATLSIRDLALELKELMPERVEIEFTAPRAGDIKTSCAAVNRLKEAFEPSPLQMQEALRETIGFYRENLSRFCQ